MTEIREESSHWLLCAVSQEEITCMIWGQGSLLRKKHLIRYYPW